MVFTSCPSPNDPGCRLTALAPAPLAGVDAWTNVTAGQRFSPPPLVGASLAYDPLDNYLILFGGCTATRCPAPPQTWKFAGGNWTLLLAGASQPPARAFASMTYDSKDGYLVLFGGWAGPGRPLNDTWGFVGGIWSNLTSLAPAPPPGGSAAMTYDHGDGYALLFGGGPSPSSPVGWTWRFVGGAWKNLTATAGAPPSSRMGASLSWDDQDGYALLFGGRNASGGLLGDTWTFSKGKWTPANLTSTVNPPARVGEVLTFSGVDNAVLLFGGMGSGSPLGDLWRYVGAKWTNLSATYSPVPRARAYAAALDSSVGWTLGAVKQKNGFLLVAGGGSVNASCLPCGAVGLNETWIFEPLLQASATASPSVVEAGQPTVLSAVVTGGSPPYLLSWRFGDGSGALAASPTHSYPSPGTYNVSVNAVDLAGVADSAAVSVSVVAGPAVTASPSPSTTDVDLAVHFNATATGGSPPYSFRWNLGDATQVTGGSTTHAYGLPGTYYGNVTATDAVGGTGLRTFTVHVNPALSMVGSVPPSPVTAGSAGSFRVLITAGTPTYSVTWSFGDGTISTAQVVSHSYAGRGTYAVHLAVRDAVGAQLEENFSVEVSSSPSGPSPTFLGLPLLWWPVIVAGIVLALVGLLWVRRRRRRHPPAEGPIAAAAVQGRPWDGPGEGEARTDSRSARRNAQRWGRR